MALPRSRPPAVLGGASSASSFPFPARTLAYTRTTSLRVSRTSFSIPSNPRPVFPKLVLPPSFTPLSRLPSASHARSYARGWHLRHRRGLRNLAVVVLAGLGLAWQQDGTAVNDAGCCPPPCPDARVSAFYVALCLPPSASRPDVRYIATCTPLARFAGRVPRRAPVIVVLRADRCACCHRRTATRTPVMFVARESGSGAPPRATCCARASPSSAVPAHRTLRTGLPSLRVLANGHTRAEEDGKPSNSMTRRQLGPVCGECNFFRFVMYSRLPAPPVDILRPPPFAVPTVLYSDQAAGWTPRGTACSSVAFAL